MGNLIKIAHPYCSSLDRFQEEFPIEPANPKPPSIFIEIYPSERMHFEALTEFCMIGDLFDRGYKDITIFLKSWNIDENWKMEDNTPDSVTENKWIQFLNSFLFRRYNIPPHSIKIATPNHFFEKFGNEAVIDIFLDSGLDFTIIGNDFAACEYWPWDEIPSKTERDARAKSEGKMSFIGLRYITSVASGDKTGKRYVIIRPASTKKMTEKMTEKSGIESEELKQLFDQKKLTIFYTDESVSLSSQGKKSFLRYALERSRHWRNKTKEMNEMSNSILNHFDSENVMRAVVEDLLTKKASLKKEEELPIWVGKKKLITRSVCLDVEQNQKAVIDEFKNFHEFSVNLPTSNSTNLLCWLNNNKENFTKLITQYKENLKDAQDKNEPFVEEGYLKFKLDEKIQTKEFNIFVDEIKSRLKNKNPESELIKANIVNIERKKKPKSARKKVPRGAPPYFYKIELDKLKLVFHIYETIDLNPSEKFG